MNKSKYKIYNGKRIKSVFDESKYIFLVVLFACGLIIGAFSTESNETLKNLTVKYIEFRNSSVFSELFLKSVTVNLTFILIIIFSGFSLIGTPLIYCLIFIRGMGTGALCGFLYYEYGLSGIGFSVLTMMISILISVYSLILCCKDSINYSLNAFLKAIKGRGNFEYGETKIYLFRQIIYIILTVFSSAVDSIFSLLFSRFFKF